jgi:hypothetical protein
MTAPERVSAMVDDALDIRPLLDPRQLQFPAGRWRDHGPVNFSATWRGDASDDLIEVVQPPVSASGLSSEEANSNGSRIRFLPASWLEQIKAFDARAQEITQITNGLNDHAERMLRQYLCMVNVSAVPASDVCV